MRSRIASWLTAMTAVAALAIPGRVAAHDDRYPYVLIDLGTFGGPQAGQGNQPYLSNTGLVAGTADTATPDPYYPNENAAFNEDPYIQHTFLWQKGVLTDLGALPGTNSSYANGINAHGDEAGLSDNGVIDPLTHLPEVDAILWKDGRIINLGTLGGNESQALALNDADQVVGTAQNAIPDPVSMLGLGTQTRAFIWQGGGMRDLGTLGGPDSFAVFVNNRGQVAGVSDTNAIGNPVTGQPQMDLFLWQGGQMRDLGTLGGTVFIYNSVNALNNRGEVVGQSDLAGDQIAHPFLWDGRSLKDLGTLGGDFGSAAALNDAGDVVGWTTTPGNLTAHAVLWRNGGIRDLGVSPGDTFSFASAINGSGQVVGTAGTCGGSGCIVQGVLWQNSAAVDLNTLVAPSDLRVTDVLSINDRGEIVGYGRLPNGNHHQVLLVPTEEADRDSLTPNAPAPGTVAPAAAPQASAVPCADLPPWRALLAHRQHPPCPGR